MKKIILSGCNGKMGRVITACVEQRADCDIIAGVDMNTEAKSDFVVYRSIAEYEGEADVIIDFSHPSALDGLLAYAGARKLPIVLATTGYDKEQIAKIEAASKEIPVFFSFNMSIGVNLLIELAKKAAVVLGDQFDIEIVEKHHNQKVDAPSGTAIMLAEGINEARDHAYRYTYDRHSQRKKREPNEIGIQSVRGGTIVGEHEVIFAGHDELLTLTHTAMSKEIFATGAVNAAIFLSGKPAGFYNMGNLVE